jgi:hypothetical protein
MLKQIALGLKKLQEQESFWGNAVKESRSEEALSFNLAHHRNASRALGEFKQTYKARLDHIEKYPFLAK